MQDYPREGREQCGQGAYRSEGYEGGEVSGGERAEPGAEDEEEAIVAFVGSRERGRTALVERHWQPD